MSRKYTSRNHDHPHYQLKAFLQRVKEELRKLSAKEFADRFDSELVVLMQSLPVSTVVENLPTARHAQMRFILQQSEIRFKAIWAEKAGWDFDDCYDVQKYAEHIKTAMKAKEPVPA